MNKTIAVPAPGPQKCCCRPSERFSPHHELSPNRWRACTRMQSTIPLCHPWGNCSPSASQIRCWIHMTNWQYISNLELSLVMINILSRTPRIFTSISNITVSASINILDTLNIRTCFIAYSKTTWHGMTNTEILLGQRIILLKCCLAKRCGAWHFVRSFST